MAAMFERRKNVSGSEADKPHAKLMGDLGKDLKKSYEEIMSQY